MKKLLSIILSAIILMTVTVYAEDVEKPMQKSVLKVAVNAEFAPFEYYEDEELKGFDIDLINYIGERIGYEIEYKNKPFEALFLSVMSGETDCAISAVTITEERKKNLRYTKPYIMSENDGVIENYGIATANDELCEKLNSALAIAKADGTVEELLKKYKLDELNNYSVAYTDVEQHQSEASGSPLAPPSDWAISDVEKAKALNITQKDKIYRYSMSITREEFCELIYNLVTLVNGEITVPITDSFTDTKNDKILMLNGLGIINGKSATEFAPNDLLTREEAATIIIRMINKIMPMAATEMWFEYDDIEEVSEWASDSVQIISNLGFMNGVGNNNFAPKDTYTTEQAIVTLVRVFEGAEAAGATDRNTSIGIIGGADGPTSIIVGDDVNIIQQEGYEKFYDEIKKNTTDVDDFYVDEAIKLITESGELAADKEFINNYTADEAITEKIATIGNIDYKTPKEIYYISADRQQIIENIKELSEGNLDDADVEKLLKFHRLDFSVIGNLINSSYGVENLAALTILTNSRGYIMPKDFLGEFSLYLIYDGEYSALVSFSEFGDGIIKATMSFVRNGEKDNIFRRVFEITQGFGEEGITVAKAE